VLTVGALPSAMQVRFLELVEDDDLALRAAIQIARFRKRHRRGPTFSELFESLPETNLASDSSKQSDARTTYAFRHHLAVQWRREGWIQWGWRQERSLATGWRFREASKKWARELSQGA